MSESKEQYKTQSTASYQVLIPITVPVTVEMAMQLREEAEERGLIMEDFASLLLAKALLEVDCD